MRFIEQTNLVYSTAKSDVHAKELVERLRLEYFVDYIDKKTEASRKSTAELLDMQKRTYNVTKTGTGLYLEISDDKR